MDRYDIISDNGQGLFAQRLSYIYNKVSDYLLAERQQGRQLAYVKILLSDIANQADQLQQSPLMKDLFQQTACTIIQQPPIGGAKMAVLIKTSSSPSGFVLHSMRLKDEEVANFGSYVQTVMLFDKYKAYLADNQLTLKDHCIRTWIYVRDIDTNYDGMVKARNDIFRQQGLTAETHFIASTGIGGRSQGRHVSVAIDFLTAPAVKPDDIMYLKALDHLNPTHEYGVAFERGVRIRLKDSYQYFISGTASINNRGEVINVGDVARQTERLLENIAALLADGGAGMQDVRYFIIYLRDLADAPIVDAYMQAHFPNVPRVLTYAKVCRPAWLVEMECVATKT